jgi:hypothetical protein
VDLSLLATLRQKLSTSTQFSDITDLYFEDVLKGLVSVAPADGQCHHARFSGRAEFRPTLPSLN